MLSSHRVLTLLAASGAVAAVAMPVAALAHGGGGGRRSAQSLSAPKRICSKVGVPLDGSSHGGTHANGYGYGYGYGSLTETQVAALKTACEKLAPGYVAEHSADMAALNANQAALEPELAQLNTACPRWHGHDRRHGSGATGSTGATGATGSTGPVGESPPTVACEEARNAFDAKVKETEPKYRQAENVAATVFDVALTEFEETVKATVGSGFTQGRHHHHHHGTGSTGSTGSTGANGPTLPTGPTGPGPSPGGRGHR
jgi:hypothetical protein